ncbi:MAG: hypothetical protein WBB82_02780 [Limnothrix sp.]
MASSEKQLNISELIEPIRQDLLAIAAQQNGDGTALLQMLRELETLHRQICETHFYPNLPNRRRDLYNLLRDMEEKGGWPYIARPKLAFVLDGLLKSMELANQESHNDPEAD